MRLSILFSLLLLSLISAGQSPGLIVRPAGGNGVTILNPNGDAYSSSTTSGFTTNDITQSEVAYKIVPPAVTEPTGDIATGPSGGFTDIVKTVDQSGFYIYSDGTNLLMRLRIGGIISGSKGYSVLIDTDSKIGNSGVGADPNYIAPTNTSNGNAGFEYEVVLQTNFQVAVYNVDGSSNPGSPISTYALTSNSQISTALSTDGNNPDYFYDWYVPLSAIGNPSSFRLAATTVTSPSSALQGSRSDIYGIDDSNGTPADLWTSVVKAQPTITIASISGAGTSTGAVCTAAPVLNSPINTGSSVSVSGTWTRMDASKPSSTTITLYKNDVAVNTTTVNTGGTWNITVPTVSTNDVFYAKAQSVGESMCLQSNSVTAGCTSTPAAPTISCASTKGITGNIPLGTTVSIYQVTTGNASPTTTLLSSGLTYTNNGTDQIFNYFGTNPQSGNACQGQNGILATNSTYMFVTNNGGCVSTPVFICITGSSQNSWNYITSNSLALTTPIYPYQNSVSGSGATSGQVLRLFVNDKYVTSTTATGSAFTFSGLTLNTGDNLKVYAQASAACMTVSSTFTVSCYTAAPTITTNSAGNLLTTSTSISGKSSYNGATVSLYRGTSPSGTLVGTATVNSSGNWSVTGLVLAAGETYYATQVSSGCTSPASSSATVAGTTTVCPAFSSASYSETVSSIGGSISSFTGTVRLYLDGTLIGQSALTAATTWSIPVNTNYSNALYPGGVLTVTAQSAGNAESANCSSTATITCSSPSTPGVSPTSSTITTGQTVTYSVSNVSTSTWYSVRNSSGTSFAKSLYSSGTSNLSITTSPFNTAGTYQLNIAADKLSGCALSTTAATVVVNNATVPVNFVSVEAKRIEEGVNVRWQIDNEQNVQDYTVQVSTNGVDFKDAGTVAFKENAGSGNEYQYKYVTTESGVLYFRVKETDNDGRFMYSKIVSVASAAVHSAAIAPNPSRGSFSVTINSNINENITISVHAADGRIVSGKKIGVSRGANVFPFQMTGAVPGVYNITIKSTTATQTLRLLIL